MTSGRALDAAMEVFAAEFIGKPLHRLDQPTRAMLARATGKALRAALSARDEALACERSTRRRGRA
jgi:hypothetical protein